jgi:serpin B
MTRSLVWAAALVGLAACHADETPGDPRAIASRTTEMAAVSDGNDEFAFDVLGATREAIPGNLFFSPFSLSSALGMTYGGARGETATQLHDALHVGLDDAVFHETLGAYVADVGGEHERAYTLDVANRVFVEDGYPVEPAFLDLTSTTYGAPADPLDFVGDPEGSRDAVNGWVADQTRDRIDELMPAGSITSDTRFVLANAIYFFADWQQAFDPAHTGDGVFHAPSGDVTVPQMYGNPGGEDGLTAAYDEDFSMIRLPYQGNQVSMLVILPTDPAVALAEVEPELDATRLQALVDGLAPTEASVQLPKFELRTELQAKETLEALGVVDAFDGELADFSGIATDLLWIDDVYHQAFVSVDEQGTEAAAATGSHGTTLTSAPIPFVADRPFLFAIHDDLTGTVLFLGRVTEP